jgi:hypothetical protein
MMTLTAYYPAFTDLFGEHKEWKSEWEPELETGFGLNSDCYVITKNWLGRYYIQECTVSAFWFTNIWGWEMTNGWKLMANDYGKKVFKHDELQKAIEICEKKNRMRKVKVKHR